MIFLCLLLMWTTLSAAVPQTTPVPQDLKALTEQTLRTTLELRDNDQVSIDRVPNVVIAPDEKVELNLMPGQPKRGHMRLEGWVYHEGEKKFRFEIDAKVTLIRNIFLLKTEKRRADPIRPDDLVRVVRDVTYESDMLTDDSQLKDIEAVGLLPAGVVLTTKNTRPIPDVRRGDMVQVEVFNGRVQLQYMAEAREDGVIGHSIVCRNPDSGKTFPAVVEGKGRVLVDMEVK